MNRRKFLQIAAGAGAIAAVGGTCYGFFEAGWVRVDRQTIPVPRLPPAFRGTRVAFLTDIHHGPYVDLEYVAAIVRTTNLLQADLIILGGDYSLREKNYIGPCLEVLGELRAPMGVYGVLGNHDYWHGLRETRDGLRSAKVMELTNTGVWFEQKGERLRLAGVDDLWEGSPDVVAALGDATRTDCCLLVSHNPDLAESIIDRTVGLVLSGHTHGGQVVFPGYGAPWVPSKYGQKYLHGLVEAPATQVFVSRGLGVAAIPARFGSRPEINLITLV
jgi:predicted MPP superfamily phosphohydrolase